MVLSIRTQKGDGRVKVWTLGLGMLLALPAPSVGLGGIVGSPPTRPGAMRHQVAPLVFTTAGRVEKLPYLLAQRTTNYYHAIPSQAKNIELVASRLNGTVVEPGETFSYYRRVGPYSRENGYGWGRMFAGNRILPSIGGGVCQGSSTLYSALLRTGLPIVERHQHGLMVPYLPPGEDATVASDYLDFRFKNNRATPILIASQAGDRHITVRVWGASPSPQIVVKHKILAEYPYTVETTVNSQLKPGEEVVKAPGQAGVKVRSWLEIKTPSGVHLKDLGIDTYRSSPRVIEVGPTTP